MEKRIYNKGIDFPNIKVINKILYILFYFCSKIFFINCVTIIVFNIKNLKQINNYFIGNPFLL